MTSRLPERGPRPYRMVPGPEVNPPPSDERSVLRTVQRTGGTSLSVTLPKSWTESFHVRVGTIVRLRDLGGGRLEVTLEEETGTSAEDRVLRVDASEAPPGLLTRVLVGAYITGYDRVVVTAEGSIPPDLRDEVEGIAPRMLGVSLIGDEPACIEIRIFLDASRHRLPALLDRLAQMLGLQLGMCEHALRAHDLTALERAPHVEEEIDRFYLLMSRQLLLASDDFEIARDIGVPSHHLQIGDRLVVKMLEVVGDRLTAIAESLRMTLPGPTDSAAILRELEEFGRALDVTMAAFRGSSVHSAHRALDAIAAGRTGPEAAAVAGRRPSRPEAAGGAVTRVRGQLDIARSLLGIVNETTINRAVEPDSTEHGRGRPLQLRPAREPHPVR